MLKIAVLIWMLLATVLAGTSIAVIAAVPQLMDQATLLIPALVGGACVIAIPVAILLARQIYSGTPQAA